MAFILRHSIADKNISAVLPELISVRGHWILRRDGVQRAISNQWIG